MCRFRLTVTQASEQMDALVSVVEIKWIHRRIAERLESDAQVVNCRDSGKGRGEK